MRRSPLHDAHLALGARMAEFAGWEMPIQYSGIGAEHRAVREAVGIFDISHMGEFVVTGTGATAWLDSLLTNHVAALASGAGQYTLLLNNDGGVIDDLFLYRISEEAYWLVVNASKIEDDFAWLEAHRSPEIILQNQSDDWGAIAVQGPLAVAVWEGLATGCPLPARHGIRQDKDLVLCRTGYTGEDGFELFAPCDRIGSWWEQFLKAGVAPCGLGARDTLRLEKCYPLNGSDLDPEHTPLEAGLGFFVALDKPGDFIGAEKLRQQRERGLVTRLAALLCVGRTPPLRHGYEVVTGDGTVIGELSSGTLSPSRGLGIGLAYLPAGNARIGQNLSVRIRNQDYPVVVVKKPFV
jgi:aminomethyltransferase